MQRVVVTGIGLTSVLGQDLASVSASLRHGISGIVSDPERTELGFRSSLTGALAAFDPKAYLGRKERRSMNEPALYAGCSAVKALDDARLDRSDLAGPMTGVILGNDSNVGDASAVIERTRSDGSTRNVGSSAVVDCMNSSPSINLSVLLKSQGACWTVSAACASGAHSIGQAWSLIATGQQDVVVCGGTQEIGWRGMAGFDGLNAFSTREGDPVDACRPFSHDRDGLVPSGGAAILVLESLEHAQARDARVRAEVLSYAFSSDGHHVTSPSGAGAARCIRRALDLAGLTTRDIDYLSAHAAGTVVGDAVEAQAILDVFGDHCPPVSSTKSLTGHECWMAGASEAAYAMLMAEGGFLAPNRNFSRTDEGLEGLNVVAAPTEQDSRYLLSNSFGFGGTNACLVFDAVPAHG
ncbi:MAG: beta-ketoacyl-[acyl-carrier-protein] synthase family protein [Proteobacteria bacterium]|nr:beta-ketoacyl-[acyl-carrier-protein] synthase family protein [Pseudomonadota bacterium]MCP4915618.1 beta-ketoacyl-[acyl-carrier-protein] synthase family protein [Pseudomonadota bacterium]